MKSWIIKASKTNLINASIIAVLSAIVSNYAFNFTGELFLSSNTVNIANNVIDVLQLALYITARLYRSKCLNRYDLPFVSAGIVSILS